MAFVSFWHLPLHEFSVLLQVVVLKFNQCSFFFLSLGCVVTGSPVISTLAEIWCKCAKLSSQCANEPSLEAKGYEHRARLIDFTVLSRTAFCPKTHTHTRSCTRCYKTWQLIPCFIYFIGCLVITSLSSLRDANLGDRARPMLHTRGKINNWANIRRTRQMLKSSTKDGAAGRRGLCVAFHCICTVNVPSGTTVCGRRCDLALSHLFFGTHFFFFSFLIFFFATCYSLVTPIIIFN